MPRGDVGTQGIQGNPGTPGTPGVTPTVSIGTVIAGSPPAVSDSGTPPDVVLNFTIPDGSTALAAPVITSQTGSISRVENSAFNYTLTATGNPAPTLNVTGVPAWMTWASPHLSGTVPAHPAGPWTMNLSATNGQLPNAAATLTLNVTQALTAPVITSSVAPISREENTTFSYTITATGNPTPTLSVVSGLPATMTYTAPTISGTVPAHPSGPHNIVLRAQNSEGTDDKTLVLTVTEAAPGLSAPTITSATTNVSREESTAYSYTLTATGNPTPTLNATVTPAGSGLTFTSPTLSGTLPAHPAGPFTINLSASNGQLPNATASFTLTVTEAPAGSPVAYISASGAPPAGPHDLGVLWVQNNTNALRRWHGTGWSPVQAGG